MAQLLWRGSRTWTAALVLAAFPLLFVVDQAIETRLSPVLPGLAVLLVLLLGLPFALTELQARRFRRRDLLWQDRRSRRYQQSSRYALGLAAVWLVAWFALGA